ncbi:unnamed protein product, partial [Symbiodinium necroappetens]
MAVLCCGLAVFAHRDCSHKLAREEVLAAAAVPQVQLAKRQVMLDHVLLEWVAPGIIQERQLRPDASMAEIKAELMKVAASEIGIALSKEGSPEVKEDVRPYGTLKNALATHAVQDVLFNVEDEDVILTTHWRYVVAEWEYLLKLEAQFAKPAEMYPLKQLGFTRWYCYRELMTYAEERRFQDCFRNLRSGEKKQSGLASPAQLQAVSLKALNTRYSDYETVQADPGQIHAIPPSQTIKSSIFDPRRATGQDTGLPGFNAVVRATVTSAHHLTRRSLNLWSTVLRLQNDLQSTWIAELRRTGQVLGCGEHLWLVVDAPYVHLKVWPLVLQDVEIRGERDVNPSSVADCRIFDCQPVFNTAVPGLSSIVLKMGDSRPLLNHALEHYASRYQASLSQFSLCMGLGLLPGGLSANALRTLCVDQGCPLGGSASKRACCEKLLMTLGYDEDARASISASFRKQSVENDDNDDQPADCDFDDDDKVRGLDASCEAELLNRLLAKMEATEVADAATKPEAAEPRPRAVAWPASERGLGQVSVVDDPVPEGCRLSLHTPQSGSPNIQAFLPSGEKWQGKESCSRAYRPSGALMHQSNRASRTFESAKAEVVAWLWSWHDAKNKESAEPASSSEPASKRA